MLYLFYRAKILTTRLFTTLSSRTRNIIKFPHLIPVWLFLIVALAVISGGFCLSGNWNFMQRFQQPDTVLAWIALCVAWLLWTQLVTGLRGISYIFAPSARKKTLDETHVSPPFGGWYMTFLKSSHWIVFVFMGIFLCILIKSTFFVPLDISNREVVELIQNSNQELIQALHEDTQAMIEEFIQAQHEDMQILIERIDDVLKQNTEILERLEAQYVTGNDTTNDQP